MERQRRIEELEKMQANLDELYERGEIDDRIYSFESEGISVSLSIVSK